MYLEPEWVFFAELSVEEPECFLIQLFNFSKKIILKKKKFFNFTSILIVLWYQ